MRIYRHKLTIWSSKDSSLEIWTSAPSHVFAISAVLILLYYGEALRPALTRTTPSSGAWDQLLRPVAFYHPINMLHDAFTVAKYGDGARPSATSCIKPLVAAQ
jgi:hypothetical protein